MRHMEICRKHLQLQRESDCTLVYYVTVNDLTEPLYGLQLESFGVGITICENSETALVPHVTFSKSRVLSLAEKLARHFVTPVSVNDVVEDWLVAD